MNIINTSSELTFVQGNLNVSCPKGEYKPILAADAQSISVFNTQQQDRTLKITNVDQVDNIIDNGLPIPVPNNMFDLYSIIKPFFFSIGGDIPIIDPNIFIEPEYSIPAPVQGWGADNNRSSSAGAYEGGAYKIDRYLLSFNRLWFRTPGTSGVNPGITFAAYQRPDGQSGVAPKVFEVFQGGLTPGDQNVVIPTSDFVPGLIYFIHGRTSPSGSYQIRVYNTTTVDGYNTLNVAPAGYYTSFSTNLNLDQPLPPVFDPRVSGPDVVQSSQDLIPIVSLYKV